MSFNSDGQRLAQISRDEARLLVERRLCKSAAIERLTDEEEYILWGETGRTKVQKEGLPGTPYTNIHRGEWPDNECIRAEYQRADARWIKLVTQRHSANNWLIDNGFTGDFINPLDLERRLDERLPNTGRHLPTITASSEAKTDGLQDVEATAADRPGKVRKKGHGRPEWNWSVIEPFIVKLLKEKGNPTDPKNMVSGWRGRSDVMRAVQEWCQNRSDRSFYLGKKPEIDKAPGDTTVKSYLADNDTQ
jgi:hypothetical protein